MTDPATRVVSAAHLDNVGVDIRVRANVEGMPLFVRERVVRRVVALLQSGENVLLRGPSGVGKSALVYSLALAQWPAR